MPTQILVIGGRGFYGQRVVELTRRVASAEVYVGGRTAEGPDAVRLDLADPSSLPVLDDFEVVVNAADALSAPPHAALTRVLKRGGWFVDLSADPSGVERALRLRPPEPRGRALVGAGIFPGLSTAMAAAARDAVGSCRRLELGVRLSPLSGSGRGNVALMMETLEGSRALWRAGVREEGVAVGPGPLLRFSTGEHGTVGVALPDAALLHALAPQADVQTFLALSPAVLRHNLRLLSGLLRALGPLAGLVRAPTRWSLALGRALLLRDVHTPVELVAIANRGEAADHHAVRARVPDGQRAMGAAAAATVRALPELDVAPGVHVAGAVVPLASLVDGMRALDGDGAVALG